MDRLAFVPFSYGAEDPLAVTFTWDFGDGSAPVVTGTDWKLEDGELVRKDPSLPSDAAFSPSHAYFDTGEYIVTVTGRWSLGEYGADFGSGH